MTAMELNTHTSGVADFPYKDVESFVDDIMEALEEEFPEQFQEASRQNKHGDTEHYQEQSSKTDTKDNHEQSPSLSFCPSCGVSLDMLDDPSFCPECGDEISL